MCPEISLGTVIYRGWYDIPDYWGRERYQHTLRPRIEELAQTVHDAGRLLCMLVREGYTLSGIFSMK